MQVYSLMEFWILVEHNGIKDFGGIWWYFEKITLEDWIFSRGWNAFKHLKKNIISIKIRTNFSFLSWSTNASNKISKSTVITRKRQCGRDETLNSTLRSRRKGGYIFGNTCCRLEFLPFSYSSWPKLIAENKIQVLQLKKKPAYTACKTPQK